MIMKKRNIKSLALNKNSISHLQHTIGGRLGGNADGSMLPCDSNSCDTDCNTQGTSTLGCTETV